MATTSKFEFCAGAEYWMTGGTNTRRSERLSRLSHRLNAENNSAVAENAVVTQAVPSLRAPNAGPLPESPSSATRPSAPQRQGPSGRHDCGVAEARNPLAITLARPRPGLHGLDVAVAWRTGRGERSQQPPSGIGDIIDRLVERCLVRLRRGREPAQLSDELQRGGADLLLGRGRLEIEQSADIAAHRTLLGSAFTPCHIGPWQRRCRSRCAIGRGLVGSNGKPVSVPVDADRRTSGLLLAPGQARACLVLAHGAGAGMTHPFMAAVAAELAQRGIATLRYQFPYMEQHGKRPDPPKLAHATVRAAAAEAARLLPKLPLFAGGKSFGGRMTSQAQAAARS